MRGTGGRPPVPLTLLLPLLLLLTSGLPVSAQSSAGLGGLVQRLAGMTAVTGYEQRMADSILALLPGATRDRAGNVVRDPGGKGRRVLMVCPLDEPGWVVGSLRSDGYLTLRRSAGRAIPGRDAQLQGARIDVHGRRGVLPGVVAVRSVHLTRGRGTSLGEFTSDSAYVDLGASTAAEVESLGVRVLSVVTLAKRPHRYGADLLAAPSAGRRAACAALLEGARAVGSSRAVVGFVVEQELSERGLTTVANRAGPFAQTFFVDGSSTVSTSTGATNPALGQVTRITLPVRYPGTPVETVSMAEVARLRDDLIERLRGVK